MKPLKTKVSITLDSEIIEAVRDLAERDDRSFSQYINLVLKEHLRNQKKILNTGLSRMNKNPGRFLCPGFLKLLFPRAKSEKKYGHSQPIQKPNTSFQFIVTRFLPDVSVENSHHWNTGK